MRLVREYARERAALSTALEARRRFDCRAIDTLTIQMRKLSSGALTGFAVALRATPGGVPENAHVTVQAAAFTTPSQVVPYVSADPATLGAGAGCLVTVAVEEVESCEILIAGPSGGAVELSAGGYAID